HTLLHPILPGFLKAKNVFIEMVSGRPIFHHYANMNDSLRNSALGQKLPKLAAVHRSRPQFHKLDVMTVGIANVESPVSIPHWLKLLRNFTPAAREIRA